MSKAPPASFVYMGRPFDIRIENDPLRLLAPDVALSALGVAGPNEGLLAIRAGQTPVEERDTVLHELIHFVLEFAQAQDDAHFVNRDALERVVALVSAGLLALFWENPALLTYLARP